MSKGLFADNHKKLGCLLALMRRVGPGMSGLQEFAYVYGGVL